MICAPLLSIFPTILFVNELLPLVKSIWRLKKSAQDALLWSLARKAKGPTRRTWHIDGKVVCRDAFCQILGVGKDRLLRVSQTFRGMDMRGALHISEVVRALNTMHNVHAFDCMTEHVPDNVAHQVLGIRARCKGPPRSQQIKRGRMFFAAYVLLLG